MPSRVLLSLSIILVLLSLVSTIALGETGTTRLDTIVVIGTEVNEEHIGQSKLDSADIETIPLGDGDATDALKVIPGVQFPEEDRSSLTGGEIAPAKISISGGRVFQNNFLIDGFGNNSYLDPVADNPNQINNVPGHPQALFLRSRLIQNVTVHRSNISAKHGAFNGGVVEMQTRDPGPEFGGAFFYRGTRDEWTSFHIDDADLDAFENSISDSQQPNFLKQNGGLELNIPLGETSGLLGAYEIIRSDITLHHFGDHKDQKRQSENFFLKYLNALTPETTWRSTVIHSPYKSEHFIKNALDSDFSIKGGGQTINTSLERLHQWGTVTLSASYSYSENSRSAPDTFWNWAITPSRAWGDIAGTSGSTQGGFADLEQTQKTWEAHLDVATTPQPIMGLDHILKTGLELRHLRGTMDRSTANINYSRASTSSDVICNNDPEACVDGEQFFILRSVYDSGSAKAIVRSLGLYGEDTIGWDRLELRPGLRYSYDDLLENHNIAPRVSASFDLFGSGKSILLAGWNRYFGNLLLTSKLRESLVPLRIEERALGADNRPGPWTLKTQTNTRTRFSDLETPRTDEIVLGFEQKLFGGTGTLEFVKREGYDQFTRERSDVQPDGFRYFELNNNGRTHYKAYHAGWQRVWRHHQLFINATYQKTRTNAEDYDDTLDAEDLEERIYYNGEVLQRDDLLREDFNRPWTANILYAVDLPWDLRFSNFTQYRSGYRALENSGDDITLPDGETVDVYEKIRQPHSWVFDWKLSWHKVLKQSGTLGLNLEVLNVFNEKAPVADEDDEFELGRQVWAGIEYLF